MSRGILFPRMMLSAFLASGCSPQRDTEPRTVEIPLAVAPPAIDPATPEALPIPEPEKRLFAMHRHVWVRSAPSDQSTWLGYLGLGGVVRLRGPKVAGSGCTFFQPIEPRGFVCLDDRATLDSDHTSLPAIRAIAPRLDSPWPHHYAESRQAPRYVGLPSREDQDRREFQLGPHLESVRALRSGDFKGEVPWPLRDVDVAMSGNAVPAFLSMMPKVHEHVPTLRAGSTLSYAQAFDAHDRTWLVTGDGVLIPKDRVAPYPVSRFEGLVIDDSMPLPVGFIKERSRPQYLRKANGTIVPRGAEWPRLASLSLTGESTDQGGVTYLGVRDGTWVARSDVTEILASPETPWGERVRGGGLAAAVRWGRGQPVPPAGHRRTWVEVSVHEGWLIAYEGTRPVRATLVATGRGEPVAPGSKSLQTSTPPGIFAIQGKYWTSTMAVNSTAHFDVPFAMPYFGAYALHAAYWHDRWGEKVSLGCVNLSPIDARWLFLWAEPTIPEGWHGMRATSDLGHPTVVVIHA